MFFSICEWRRIRIFQGAMHRRPCFFPLPSGVVFVDTKSNYQISAAYIWDGLFEGRKQEVNNLINHCITFLRRLPKLQVGSAIQNKNWATMDCRWHIWRGAHKTCFRLTIPITCKRYPTNGFIIASIYSYALFIASQKWKLILTCKNLDNLRAYQFLSDFFHLGNYW